MTREEVTIHEPRPGDGAALVNLMNALDEETQFMMLEPGERTSSAEDQEKAIASFLGSNSKAMFVAEHRGELVGFVVGVGNTANRNNAILFPMNQIKKVYRDV